MNRSDDARSSAADAPAEAPVGADERLDEAIEETFPASDPIAVSPERDDAAARAVLTVGHSTRPIADFIALLRAHGVTQLVDVRTVPRSRHNPQFGGDALAASLAAESIGYSHVAALGGLRSPRAGSINGGWRNRSFQGYADYMQTEAFADAVMTLIALAERERVAIMCAEAVPWRCHRSLIADALVARGVAACEIVSAKRLQPHRMTPFAVVEGARVTYPPEPASADGAGDDDALP
ncbi:MAG TPA: DUF488 domain-containing protein [Caldimonas sp.]|nr:DUF488 domain-containing protein [Caldimonas sp.]